MQYHPAANLFPMLPASELKLLAKDIEENGQEFPVLIYDGMIIDGRNRWEACEMIDYDCMTQEIYDGDIEDPFAYVLSLNLHRRHLSESQRAAVAAKLKGHYSQQADKRRKRGRPSLTKHQKNSSEGNGQARDKAGEALGVSGFSVDSASKVLGTSPDLFEQIELGNVAVDRAKKISEACTGKQQMREAAKRIAAGEKPTKVCKDIVEANKVEPPTMEGTYSVIYADPPWQYTSGDQHSNEEQATTIGTHYPSMSIADLCELPVADIAADDCVLWLWVTSPLLEEAFDLVNAWGFKYKTSMIWDKQKHNVGHYVSVRHELLLICTKGKPPKVPKLVDSVVSIERGKHSEKPEYFRELIDELYPKGDRVELFSRKPAKGWDAWGNEK